jgi:hypothetical protein
LIFCPCDSANADIISGAATAGLYIGLIGLAPQQKVTADGSPAQCNASPPFHNSHAFGSCTALSVTVVESLFLKSALLHHHVWLFKPSG